MVNNEIFHSVSFHLICVLLLFSLLACEPAQQIPKIDNVYQSAFNEYQVERQKERDYYLKLCGLHKLAPLTSVMGSDSLAEIIIAIEEVPKTIGTFSYVGKEINFVAEENVNVLDKDGESIESIRLTTDEYGNSITLFLGRLSWKIITRGEKPYVRIWDDKNPSIEAFKPFDRFELTEEFIFLADFQYYEEPKEVTVATQLGPPATTKFIGQLTFDYHEKPYTLDVGTGGFTMVGDATTGHSTYGGGRYIDLVLPQKSSQMIVDFNFLYNPPCTFSTYTTCQYPPAQNILSFELNAGELFEGH
jgi:uncharacterized protein (DUF1684 family)